MKHPIIYNPSVCCASDIRAVFARPALETLRMSHRPVYFVIFGETLQGRRFRPSDWSERLAGVMAPFGPPGMAVGRLAYSPYVFPRVIGGVKCVVVDDRLRDSSPLAWKFARDFARDNQLKIAEDIQDIETGVSSGWPEK